jgi:ABC-type oligopeptide transport system ATPase subunit
MSRGSKLHFGSTSDPVRAVVREMSNRIAVMFQGEIVETGSSDPICDNPQHAYTQKLLSAVPDIDRALS